ncbi:hypothetical protein CROQUDRAFT_87258 [Cronartium quercuum f. sp. fusiforme G11]|uniref:Uncharacterized protein n=1 Tax=Cronartium quercuum f. sp. fusiforme G11 TaxID=708437 RepID=A0A9P6NVL3_9BASI|nr:hypothetical protein CROQUDRAFT_87258 [Cronartium quercuum f. sp. fusiforme G11]
MRTTLSLQLEGSLESPSPSKNTSKLPPLQPGYDMEINLKSECIPPTSNLYLLSQDKEAELLAYLEVQLAKGFI